MIYNSVYIKHGETFMDHIYNTVTTYPIVMPLACLFVVIVLMLAALAHGQRNGDL